MDSLGGYDSSALAAIEELKSEARGGDPRVVLKQDLDGRHDAASKEHDEKEGPPSPELQVEVKRWFRRGSVLLLRDIVVDKLADTSRNFYTLKEHLKANCHLVFILECFAHTVVVVVSS